MHWSPDPRCAPHLEIFRCQTKWTPRATGSERRGEERNRRAGATVVQKKGRWSGHSRLLLVKVQHSLLLSADSELVAVHTRGYVSIRYCDFPGFQMARVRRQHFCSGRSTRGCSSRIGLLVLRICSLNKFHFQCIYSTFPSSQCFSVKGCPSSGECSEQSPHVHV